MNKVGIAAYGITPFSKEDKKIEILLMDSVAELLVKNPKLTKTTLMEL